MTVKKIEGQAKPWRADVRPDGVNGPRLRKSFMTKGEALAWERHQLMNKPWLKEDEPEPEQNGQRLLDLVHLWFGRHGQTLADGDRRRDRRWSWCDDGDER